jgi:hypothetical protein
MTDRTDPRAAELLALEREYRRARIEADVAFLEAFYAPELRLVGSDGSITDREADIALFAEREILPESIEHDELAVARYADTAVVTGRETVTGSYRGVRDTIRLRFIDVLVHRDGRWQLIATQSTPILAKGPAAP